MRKVVCLLLSLFLQCAAGQNFTNGKFDVKPSWEDAEVFVPGKLFNTNVRELPKMGPIDVVLYMHSCAGMKADEHQWGSFLNDMGLVVVMPDSFAIKGRVMRCGPRLDPNIASHTHSQQEIGRIRVSELAYAINQLKELPNVRKIFLMGFSEGSAMVLIGYIEPGGQDGVRVQVITSRISRVISVGSFCNGPVRVPNEVPLLTINFESDPQFPRSSNTMCAEKTAERKGMTSIVMLKGNGHEAALNRVARESVQEFIGGLRSK